MIENQTKRDNFSGDGAMEKNRKSVEVRRSKVLNWRSWACWLLRDKESERDRVNSEN